MPRVCSICSHPERKRIDALLVEAVSNRRIADDFGLSESAVRRHAANHLPKREVEARTEMREDDHFQKLRLLEKTLFTVLTRRLREEDDSLVLRVHGQLLRHYDFELRLGELAEIKAEIEELREQIQEREDTTR